MSTSCVLKVRSYTMNWNLPSASAPISMIKAAVVVSFITYQIHINGYSMWWYTSSRFSIFGEHFQCTDDDFSWCDISNSFIYLYLSVQITHDSLVIIKFPHIFRHIYFVLCSD